MTDPMLSSGTTPSPRDLTTHPAIDEARVVERYLCGDLDDAETAAFEAHALDCPRCLDELEADERFRDAFLVEEPIEEPIEEPVDRPANGPAPAPLPFASPRRPVERRPANAPAVWALAAALLVALGALFVVLQQNRELAALLDSTSGDFATPTVLRLAPLRDAGSGVGTSVEPAVRLRLDPPTSESASWVVLALDVEPPFTDRYDCTLTADASSDASTGASTDPSSETATAPLWTGALRPDPWGAATLLVPSDRLSAGRHTLRCATGSAAATSARFEVVRP